MAKLSVGIVLDESGSMDHLTDLTITGINEYLEGLKIEDDALITITMFSDRGHQEPKYRVYCSSEKPEDVKQISDRTYRPNGNTPLFDAVAGTIKAMEGDAEDRTVLVVINTDGLENASTEWTREKLFELIREKEEAGWKFIYLGVDQDEYAAAAQAQRMGMRAGQTMTYANASTKSTYSALSANTQALSQDPSMTSGELIRNQRLLLAQKEHEEREKKN